jgi:hypothetical protein
MGLRSLFGHEMTRSGYLRELAEETLHCRSALRTQRTAEINTMDGPVTSHGGIVAALVTMCLAGSVLRSLPTCSNGAGSSLRECAAQLG